MSARDLSLTDILAQLAGGPYGSVDPLARVESGAGIGDGCTIKSGAFVARGTVLLQDVRVDANACFVDHERPTAPEWQGRAAASASAAPRPSSSSPHQNV